MSRILVTDGQQRKTLAAVRALGRVGHQVLVSDETRLSLSRYSRYCAQGLLSPSPKMPSYADWLRETIRREQVDVLLPMDDETTETAVRMAPGLSVRTLLPTAQQFDVAADKVATMQLAERAGVRHPRTFTPGSGVEVRAVLAKLGGRGVMRPRHASGGRGFKVVSVGQDLAFQRPLHEMMVQELLPAGRKFDVCLLFDASEDVRAAFVQEELRWFPHAAGTSTLQMSVLRPDLVALALQLLAPIGWRGVAEVEFMEGPDGPYLMEINPRFWASLALAARCGVDFPGLAVQLAQDEAPEVSADYAQGVTCRWSLPADTLHLLRHPWLRLRQRGRLGSRPRFDDILSWDDPMPLMGFFLGAARYTLDARAWRHLMRW